MRSMTGYGKAEYSLVGVSLTVELKTVNNRYLDLTPKYPRSFISLDDVIRKTVQKNLSRGRVDLFITYQDTTITDVNLDVDLPLAKAYVDANEKLSKEFPQLNNDLTITSLMKITDVIKSSQQTFNAQKIAPILEETVNNACINLNVMRDIEGAKLKEDLLKRVQNIKEIVDDIKLRAPKIAEEYREKLTERVKEVLSQSQIDETRILQETAIFADKCNIDEELTRLRSHVAQFKAICEGTGDIGKRLDFLVQEFNREANTVCSKSNDATVTDSALTLKCEIEKVREQIQNIE